MLNLLKPGSRCFNATNVVSSRALSTSQLKEYLSILNVTKTSTPKEIKDSFLKLSKVYHPDNNVTGSHSKFVKLKEAYDALRDGAPTPRSSYSSHDENIDLSHKAYARYREKQRDYYHERTRPHGYGFGGPYAQSPNPWEEMMKARAYQRRKSGSYGSERSALSNITLMFSGLALFVIYSGLFVVFDFRNEAKLGRWKRNNHNQEYQAYVDSLRQKEAARREFEELELKDSRVK